MECVETKITEQQSTTIARRTADVRVQTPTTFRILFGMKEVVRLTGLSHATLKWWINRGWIKPFSRSKGGKGREHQFTGWQTVALALLSNAVYTKRFENTYVGSVGVRLQMDALVDLSDELLLPESRQNPHTAETTAAMVARFPVTEELTPQCLEGVARVVAALDRKVNSIGLRAMNRLR
jgi:hypothetical protein